MTRAVRMMCGAMASAFLVAAVAMFFVPATNIWPWVLLFAALSVGFGTGTMVAQEDDLRAQREQRAQEQQRDQAA